MHKKVLILSVLGFISLFLAGCSISKPQPKPLTGIAKQVADATQSADICTMQAIHHDWYLTMFPLSIGSPLAANLDPSQLKSVSDQYLTAFNNAAEQHSKTNAGFNCPGVHDYQIELAISEGFELMQKIDGLSADSAHLSERRAGAASRDIHEFRNLPVRNWTESQRNFVRWVYFREKWPLEQIGLTAKQQEDLSKTKPAGSAIKIPEQGG